jgi:hypothetical protein
LDHLSEIQFSHRERPLGKRDQPDGSVFAKLSSRAPAIQNLTRDADRLSGRRQFLAAALFQTRWRRPDRSIPRP